MAVPATTPLTENNPLYAPNDPCPEEWSEYLIHTFHDCVYTTLTRNRVPWKIMKQLADEGWTDVTSLTKRWGTEEQLYNKAVSSLRIDTLQPHQQEKIVAALAGAREDLRKRKDYESSMAARPKAAQIVDTSDREVMEQAFHAATGERLKLKYQGSANLIGRLSRAMAEGRIENLNFKDLTSFHPAPSSRSTTQQIRNDDGSYTEVETQTRRFATTLDEWKDACRIFYHSFMMAATQHQEHPRIQPDWEPLRDFYEEFLFGSRIAERRNPPTVAKLVYTERCVWQLIIEKMWEDKYKTLPSALREIKDDSLWWTNELTNTTDQTNPTRQAKGKKGNKGGRGSYNYNNDNYNNYGNQKGGKNGKGRSKGKGRGVWQHQFTKGNGSKGRGKKGQRNDLQQRQLPSQQNGTDGATPHGGGANNRWGQNQSPPQANQPRIPRQQWLQRPDRNVPYCENYHVRGACQEGRNCQREHTCPACGQGYHSLINCRNL